MRKHKELKTFVMNSTDFVPGPRLEVQVGVDKDVTILGS